MSNRELVIDGTRIADDTDCWVIAEIGHNHQGSLEQCKELFAEASPLRRRTRSSSRSATTAALYTREFFNRPYENENSYGPTYGQHREALEFGRAEYQELKAYARRDRGHLLRDRVRLRERGVAGRARHAGVQDRLRRPDQHAAARVRRRDRQADDPLHRRRHARRRPARVRDCVAEINPQVALLQCTAGYPVENWDELDLRVIETYRELFPDAVVGYSGHDNGIAMPVAAYVLGAPDRREALHAQPRDEGHRPPLLARAVGPAQARPRPPAHAARARRRRQDRCTRARPTRSRRWARRSSPRATLPAGHTLAARGSRAQVARRRRPAPVRARRGDRPHAAPPGRRGRGA